MQTRKALLIIDLQQDFISPEGPFKETHVRADHIIFNLRTSLSSFREQNGTVIWIKSDYSKLKSEPKYLIRPEGQQFEGVPMNDAMLSDTHHSFPLCIPGTDGANFDDNVYSILNKEQDQVICKTYYSAFTDTTLADVLKEVQEVHVCGLVTNRCVQATVTDAFFHGHKIFIWTDCLGCRSDERHRAALENIERWYATLTTSRNFIAQSKITT
ncbi:unnamed protein product [Rotaria magnacalcarata]|uniref:Isochorismatase-like domain-containing protein n=1 Tax=Rotaria magnacalcarata TaxID=392030 RepID=A0A816XCU1_9BILA|nr:unnamed protein product [Rotaria magnacalcarata]CAF1597720.1 unnamed protein product [Rotaria magnacalcarata]CAF2033382.1 unnamed protein product [Rotaria magnacalcarata]CAF2145438.1 unnamed protein product [Rotaria magnacalcarata]CAF3751406.1 unnamed protein product [Rotaria magnacalcarata]